MYKKKKRKEKRDCLIIFFTLEDTSLHVYLGGTSCIDRCRNHRHRCRPEREDE